MGLYVRICLGVCLTITGLAIAAPDDVTFPPPIRSGGAGIFSVLQARRDVEHFEERLLHWEVIGNLLWASSGINRPDDAARTVPVLTRPFSVVLYLLAEEGAWRYDPIGHRLEGLVHGDLREMARAEGGRENSIQPFEEVVIQDGVPIEGGGKAPVVLLLVASGQRLFGLDANHTQMDDSRYMVQAALQAGHIAQNIQLVAASEDLGVHVQLPPRESENLVQQLELSAEEEVLLVMRLGYPATQ